MIVAIPLTFRSTIARLLGSVVFALIPVTAVAQTEIHRCAQADGTVAFQETPCPDPERAPVDSEPAIDAGSMPPANEDFVFTSPYDEPNNQAEPSRTDTPAPVTQRRDDCEQQTRDAIDAIDLELQQEVGADQRERYLDRLLELTAQLRACKTL